MKAEKRNRTQEHFSASALCSSFILHPSSLIFGVLDAEDPPIIDLHSDTHFMGDALRQALRAYEADEVPAVRAHYADVREMTAHQLPS